MTRVLFVCLGNICRSPAGEAILRQLAQGHPIEVSSCGLGNWHAGQRPDTRMRSAAKRRGLQLHSVARELTPEMAAQADYILAADRSVLKELRGRTNGHNIHLVTEFSKQHPGEDIPDPYYGDEAAFERVLDMLEEACSELLSHILSDDPKSLASNH